MSVVSSTGVVVWSFTSSETHDVYTYLSLGFYGRTSPFPCIQVLLTRGDGGVSVPLVKDCVGGPCSLSSPTSRCARRGSPVLAVTPVCIVLTVTSPTLDCTVLIPFLESGEKTDYTFFHLSVNQY